MIKNKLTIKCKFCNKKFQVWRSQLKTAKFCSHQCYSKSKFVKRFTFNCQQCGRKRQINLNQHKDFGKGVFCSIKCFHKGHRVWNKGIKGIIKPRNEKAYNWKGDNVGYGGVHAWVKRIKGNPKECSQCEKKGKFTKYQKQGKQCHKWNIDWANIDHKYRRKVDDYIGLCRSCHRKYDYQEEFKIMVDIIN